MTLRKMKKELKEEAINMMVERRKLLAEAVEATEIDERRKKLQKANFLLEQYEEIFKILDASGKNVLDAVTNLFGVSVKAGATGYNAYESTRRFNESTKIELNCGLNTKKDRDDLVRTSLHDMEDLAKR